MAARSGDLNDDGHRNGRSQGERSGTRFAVQFGQMGSPADRRFWCSVVRVANRMVGSQRCGAADTFSRRQDSGALPGRVWAFRYDGFAPHGGKRRNPRAGSAQIAGRKAMRRGNRRAACLGDGTGSAWRLTSGPELMLRVGRRSRRKCCHFEHCARQFRNNSGWQEGCVLAEHQVGVFI